MQTWSTWLQKPGSWHGGLCDTVWAPRPCSGEGFRSPHLRSSTGEQASTAGVGAWQVPAEMLPLVQEGVHEGLHP